VDEWDVGLDAKVAFLRRRAAYRDAARDVVAIETHMSWVFLAGAFAYKLKKPVRFDGLNFSSADLRRRNSEAELRLNRRLAPDVYLGVVPLCCGAGGRLALDGPGTPVDWLVHMRRLPVDRMLDVIITRGRVFEEEASIRRAARWLADFYRSTPSEPTTGAAYRGRLREGVRQDLDELSEPRFGLPRDRLDAVARAQLLFLDRSAREFDRRAEDGRLVEGHGDLRPEHISVQRQPAIIDCLEFDRDLRVLDPADELAFLLLECERLGEPAVGRWFLETYSEATGDVPSASLLHFHRTYRALRRATIAVRHLDDPQVRGAATFAARARDYLELAAQRSAAGQQIDH
jgi:aminoglycoside phosphotransferase family enzyme